MQGRKLARYFLNPEAETLPWEAWAEAIRYDYAFTSLIDCQIGRMLACLDRNGLRENTINTTKVNYKPQSARCT